jgi:hypothetical protein
MSVVDADAMVRAFHFSRCIQAGAVRERARSLALERHGIRFAVGQELGLGEGRAPIPERDNSCLVFDGEFWH